MKTSVVILVGGNSTRFNSTIPKPFMSLNGKAVEKGGKRIIDEEDMRENLRRIVEIINRS